MISPTKLTAVSVAAIAGCLLASGCSGSSKHAASGGSAAGVASTADTSAAAAVPATPGASAPAAVTTSTAATTSAPKVTCNQLTTAEVQPLVEDPITRVSAAPGTSDGNGQLCQWGTTGTSSAVSIKVLSGDDAKNEYRSDLASISQAVAVTGVGDTAWRDKSDSSTNVISIKGDVFCSVDADQSVPGIAELEDAAGNTSDIGDANWAIAENATATLCNRIYGSGTTTFDISALKSPAALAAASAAAPGDALPSTFSLPADSAPAAS
jgi:hypothetical protein